SFVFFFFSSRRRHTSFSCDWSSDVCSSDLLDRVSYILNKKLRGRPFASLKSSVLNELKEEIKTEDSSFQQAITLLLSTLDTRERSEERRVGKECRSRWAPYQSAEKSRSGQN